MPFDAMNTNDVTTHLMEGRAHIVKGWCKFTRNDGHGNVCALGALDQTGYASALIPAIIALAQALPKAFQCKTQPSEYAIAYFNNHGTTTKDDVLALYDRAIASSM